VSHRDTQRLVCHLAKATKHSDIWRYTNVTHVLRDSCAHRYYECLLHIPHNSYVMWQRLQSVVVSDIWCFACGTHVLRDSRAHLYNECLLQIPHNSLQRWAHESRNTCVTFASRQMSECFVAFARVVGYLEKTLIVEIIVEIISTTSVFSRYPTTANWYVI